MFDSVLERVAASVLSRYLGKYVKGLNAKNLNVGLSEVTRREN